VSELDFYKYMRESKTKDGRRVVIMKKLLRRVARSMDWMVADMDHIDSPKLTEAKDVLFEVKNYLERDV